MIEFHLLAADILMRDMRSGTAQADAPVRLTHFDAEIVRLDSVLADRRGWSQEIAETSPDDTSPAVLDAMLAELQRRVNVITTVISDGGPEKHAADLLVHTWDEMRRLKKIKAASPRRKKS